jgi:hypothetical protein
MKQSATWIGFVLFFLVAMSASMTASTQESAAHPPRPLLNVTGPVWPHCVTT